MQAAVMFEQGMRQVDVVVVLGVSAQTASRWHRAWRRDTLGGAGRAGRRSRMTSEQVTVVEAATP
jgi:transposase